MDPNPNNNPKQDFESLKQEIQCEEEE